MNKGVIILSFALISTAPAFGQLRESAEADTVHLTLTQAIELAKEQSVDAAVAKNKEKTAYWSYRTFRAEQLPEVSFQGTLPDYKKNYVPHQNSDGSYTYVRNNYIGMSGGLYVSQNIPFTGGKISLGTSLDYNKQFGSDSYQEFMSVPVFITLTQPILAANRFKWDRRIEPVRYEEAQAEFAEEMEEVTISTVAYFFNYILAQSNLDIAKQNYDNAQKLYEVAEARRQLGNISESDLMQLKLAALQARGKVTEARSNLKAKMFLLVAFLGLKDDVVIEPEVPDFVPVQDFAYNQVLDAALEYNSFAKNILRRQLEADYAVATAKGNQRSIDLYASFGYSGTNSTFVDAYGELRDNQVVSVGLDIPILDWGKRKGQVKVAESNRDVVESQIKQDQISFNQDIFLLVENFNNQAGQLEISAEADKIAQRRYEMAIQTFMLGNINILDLNDARDSKDEAKQKHIEDLYLYWNYFYNIRSVTAGHLGDETAFVAQNEN